MRKLPLQKAFAELNSARRSLIGMKRSKSFQAIESTWEDFLQNLDRIWGKVQAEHKIEAAFHRWNEPFRIERENDELLVYLNRARNATEHSIQDTLQKTGGGVSINPATPGGSLYIKRLEIKDGVMTFDSGGTPFRIGFEASRATLLPVTNRGTIFVPPTTHKGGKGNFDAFQAAKNGLSYYEGYLNSLSEVKRTNFQQDASRNPDKPGS